MSDGPPDDYEPSCIDLSLDVGPTVKNATGSIGRASAYSTLSQIQRANYLHWLSGGRITAPGHAGYALLFVCGLERRFLYDLSDREVVVAEVLRLLSACSFPRLVTAHLERFLAFSLACHGIESHDDRLSTSVIERLALGDEQDSLPIVTAWFYKKRVPLPWSWALRIARCDPIFADKPALLEQAERVQALFKIRYREQFGQGMSLTVAGAHREVHYAPVNPSLGCASNSSPPCVTTASIPDVLGVKHQVAHLVTMLSRCIDVVSWSTSGDAKGRQVEVRPERRTTVEPEARKSHAATTATTEGAHGAAVAMPDRAARPGAVRQPQGNQPRRTQASLVRRRRNRNCTRVSSSSRQWFTFRMANRGKMRPHVST